MYYVTIIDNQNIILNNFFYFAYLLIFVISSKLIIINKSETIMKALLSFFFVLLLSFVTMKAEELNMPESVIWDAANQRYLISNTANGKILSMDLNGDLSLFAQGFTNPRGMVLVNNIVYFTDNKRIYGIDINTSTTITNIESTTAYMFNDICYDNIGNLYISDMAGNSVYKFNISSQEFVKLNLNTEINAPNGLYTMKTIK